MIRELTCIVCPVGCCIRAEIIDGRVVSIEGNTCPRGKVYAENECTNPMRTLTTTVKCADGTVVPVKTSKPIPKDKIFDAMEIINKAVSVLPISVGDVIIENVFGSNIIAVANRE